MFACQQCQTCFLNGKSAYELFAFTYGEEIPKLLGISKIPAEDVCQSSKLLNISSKKLTFNRIQTSHTTSTIAELNLKRFQMRGFCALFFYSFWLQNDEIKISKTSGTYLTRISTGFYDFIRLTSTWIQRQLRYQQRLGG